MEERLRVWAGQHAMPEAEMHLADGYARREIPRIAGRLGVDLIVLGATGASQLRERILGSTARHVARAAERDVLVARGTAGEGWPRHVLLATDMEAPSHEAARRICTLPRAAQRRVTLAHVLDTDVWRSGGPVDDAERWRQEATDALHAFAAHSLGNSVSNEVVRTGRPATEVTALAAEIGADLVAVGSHGGGALERTLLGSVAEDVIERAPCSVLVVKPWRRPGPS